MAGRTRRVLLLGGTEEAAALASRLAVDDRYRPITSLAGVTENPRLPEGKVRVGGFGGAEGLGRFLAAQRIDAVVDATHPYAARISANARQACGMAGVLRLVLLRPPWAQQAGDRWSVVPDVGDARAALPGLGKRAFLTVGRKELGAFADLPTVWFLVRLIEPPAAPIPFWSYKLLLGRGPFTESDEGALLDQHAIDLLVSKNSGGDATYAKIAAARARGIPVLMIDRPPPPPGDTVATVDEALAWLEGKSA